MLITILRQEKLKLVTKYCNPQFESFGIINICILTSSSSKDTSFILTFYRNKKIIEEKKRV